MAVATSNHPAAMAATVHPHPPVAAAVVATEVKEAEMKAAAVHHATHHHDPGPTVVVVKEPVYYVRLSSRFNIDFDYNTLLLSIK